MVGIAQVGARGPASGGRAAGGPASGGGLVRQRLLAKLEAAGTALLAVVTAPAGFGKSTLLAHYARAFPGAVAWLAATPADADPSVLAGRLAGALSGVLPAPRGAGSRGDLAALVAAAGGTTDVLLVLDDAHWLETSPAEAELERALAAAPPHLHVLLGSRRMPGLNLARYELAGLIVLDAEELRFRSWEVEALLRDVYRAPLPPEDVAALARRMGGWAAGLHLFHLSTRGRPLAERRAAVAALSGRAALCHSYLARTVLAELPAGLQEFLVRTAVFDVLTAHRCDRLLDRADSHLRLADLARRQAFTTSDDGGRSFRHHEAMRSHLAVTLAAELGDAAARDWYARAATILTGDGAYAEAARAYARAEDWPAVRRLLSRLGPDLLASGMEPWRDVLPAWLVADDPWLVLAEGQHLWGRGRLAPAIDWFTRAERLFSSEDGRVLCREARSRARTWLPGPAPARGHWGAWLRAATQRHPAAVAARAATLPEPGGRLVRVAALLLAGRAAEAERLLEAADPSQPGFAGLALRCLAAAAAHFQGGASGLATLADLATEAERGQAPWLARMARAAAALDGSEDGAKIARAVAEECRRDGDRWGAVLATGLALLAAPGEDGAGAAGELATDLAAECRALDAPVLAGWARALPDPPPDSPLAALRRRAPPARPAPDPESARAPGPPSGPPPVEIRCLGGFHLARDGSAVDCATVRPKARALLRLLAMRAGTPVHREVLIETLWPDRAPEAATHCLHVALSSLRKLLGPDLLVRDGDAYRLAVPPGGSCDVATVRTALDAARTATLAGDPAGERAALAAAVTAYRGELLPEDGAAEWVTEERERLRQAVAVAAATLAARHLDAGDPAAAVAAAERCLALDRYRDEAWRVLVRAHRRAGDPGAASLATQRYADALRELGVAPTPG